MQVQYPNQGYARNKVRRHWVNSFQDKKEANPVHNIYIDDGDMFWSDGFCDSDDAVNWFGVRKVGDDKFADHDMFVDIGVSVGFCSGILLHKRLLCVWKVHNKWFWREATTCKP